MRSEAGQAAAMCQAAGPGAAATRSEATALRLESVEMSAESAALRLEAAAMRYGGHALSDVLKSAAMRGHVRGVGSDVRGVG